MLVPERSAIVRARGNMCRSWLQIDCVLSRVIVAIERPDHLWCSLLDRTIV